MILFIAVLGIIGSYENCQTISTGTKYVFVQVAVLTWRKKVKTLIMGAGVW